MKRYSSYDSTLLPELWCNASTQERMELAHAIRNGLRLPRLWWHMSPQERKAVANHVKARHDTKLAQLAGQYGMGAERFKAYGGAPGGGKSQLQEMIRIAYEKGQGTGHYTLYPAPNGGNRMLPSLYGQLRDTWVRSDKTVTDPAKMNDGHLENTLKLLNESHGNVIARATELLGKMARHFQNQPGIVHMLTELCETMQTVDVDEMYPVFKALAKELMNRQDKQVDPWPIRFYTHTEDQL